MPRTWSWVKIEAAFTLQICLAATSCDSSYADTARSACAAPRPLPSGPERIGSLQSVPAGRHRLSRAQAKMSLPQKCESTGDIMLRDEGLGDNSPLYRYGNRDASGKLDGAAVGPDTSHISFRDECALSGRPIPVYTCTSWNVRDVSIGNFVRLSQPSTD
ncbi:hypothetical protein OBBRIDRAFT_541475 [Obba rivulosa]|uniref:Uncharacterized protein n=1 Tax=Obba rivulosa TaxID=1052685 RepID=A0A8E2J649_9APHY|nr:hypothetical protein OBBRIDRAFT_541475 [Obba rivulosa]